MEKLLVTCPTDGNIRRYISKHSNFEETFPGEYETLNYVGAYDVISSLLSKFRPSYVRIMRHDSHLVELYVNE